MPPSSKLTRALVDVAMGRKPADIVVQHGRWVCVQSGEIIPDIDVAIKDGHFAFVGEDAGHCLGSGTRVIDAGQKYLVPGLLDGHMHVESAMVTVSEFVRAVVPHGTTGMFVDPHELANVLGLRGVRLMVREAAQQPIHVWVQMPSCVPAAPGLETSGASIGPAEVERAMAWPGVIGLGEMMNFVGVQAGDRKMLAEIATTRAAARTVGGHYASDDLGIPFHGYVAGGAEDDHEGTRLEDAIARVRQGMRPMLRYGSSAHNVTAQVGAITRKGLDSRNFMLCTDDSHCQTLASDGHMDRVVRHAIAEGLPPMTAIQMATINTAQHFGLSREIGMIAPGRWADLVLVEDLASFRADLVIAKGRVLSDRGTVQAKGPRFSYPAWARDSVRLKRRLRGSDFAIPALGSGGSMFANVIGVTENQLTTRHLRMQVQPSNGFVQADRARDIAKVAVFQRHRATNGHSLGFVQGFGFTENCAVASTVAHDCHQLLIVGTDDLCMARAANHLLSKGGGQVVVKDQNVIAMVDLPIAGLMSTDRVEVVAQKVQAILDGFRASGCRINSPNVLLSFLALPVIPALRISDKGLIDVAKSRLIPVLENA